MPEQASWMGQAELNGARIYLEIGGEGPSFAMIHAGVADSRQWNHEFEYFSSKYRVLRYDMRGYGRSEPVNGEFRHVDDLRAVLAHARLADPLILMGCSMGGGLALDFALANPERVRALIMVGSGPAGLSLDVPASPKNEQAAEAWKAGDLDRVAELETQIWFDGRGRSPVQVNPAMRALVYEMDRTALAHEARGLGKRLPDATTPAAELLPSFRVPLLVILGEHDEPFIHAAADHMLQRAPQARKIIMQDAAHLPNLDKPAEFRSIVEVFLASLAS